MDPSETEDLRVLVKRLEALVESARTVPLVRSQVILDRTSIYDVLDRMRVSITEAILPTRWLRQKREEDGDPPLRRGEISLDVLTDIDAMDNLIHESPPLPLTDSVRVRRDRVSPILERIRAELVPWGDELADLRSIYGQAGEPDA